MSNLMKTEFFEENTNATRTTTRRTRKVNIRLLGNLREQKLHCVSGPGPQLQLGRPPTAGRKTPAVLIHPNQFLLQTTLATTLVARGRARKRCPDEKP